jgi:hypothetical protein
MRRKTKEQVRQELGLDGVPSDEFMQILGEVGDEPIVTGPRIGEVAQPYSPAEIKDELADALVAQTVGELLARARAEAGLSLREVGTGAGVSRGRIQQLETKENIEVATLARVAEALGYGLEIRLVPETEGRPLLKADLRANPSA